MPFERRRRRCREIEGTTKEGWIDARCCSAAAQPRSRRQSAYSARKPFRISRALQTTAQFKIAKLLRPLAVNVYLFDRNKTLVTHERKVIETPVSEQQPDDVVAEHDRDPGDRHHHEDDETNGPRHERRELHVVADCGLA